LFDPAWEGIRARICHIEGLEPGSQRHNSNLTNAEANDYPNLILLCPNHHDEIDLLDPSAWPVERLWGLKSSHERHCADGFNPTPDVLVRVLTFLERLYGTSAVQAPRAGSGTITAVASLVGAAARTKGPSAPDGPGGHEAGRPSDPDTDSDAP